MISFILIAFFSLIGLLVLHEASHFLMAKKCGVKVKEFGIGYPPRIFGKKMGDTIYSLNLLPFGAFVAIDQDELKRKSFWQRGLVLGAGIISFWIFSFILIAVILFIGAFTQIDDNDQVVSEPTVQVVAIADESPASNVEIEVGDSIYAIKAEGEDVIMVDKVKDIQDIIEEYKGREIELSINRQGELLTLKLTPRILPPEGEGAIGVALVRIGIKRYSWHQAIIGSAEETVQLTGLIVIGLGKAVGNIFVGKPSGAELVGPIGIVDIFAKSGALGISYFLQNMALISLHLAIFNALPIPMMDGGRFAFLVLEKIRKKPLNEKIEKKINNIFFLLLFALMILTTIKDIIKLF